MSRNPNLVARAVENAVPRNPNLAAAPRAVAIPIHVVIEYMRDRVKAAGGDPSSVPDMDYKFLRPAAAAEMIGVSVATFYRMVEDGIFPPLIPIDRASSRPSAAMG
jgi:predicted DNA-binding transcriptional regulator AlpA